MALVNLANAKSQLGITSDDDNIDVQQKAEHATALVLARCNSTAWWRAITPDWTEATVPGEVQAAVLLVLTFLWEHRGDGALPDAAFWAAIDQTISTKKDPVIA